MSDVEMGGATAFTALRTALWPKKGTAAFWHNLRRSGQGDYKTRHAGKRKTQHLSHPAHISSFLFNL